MTLENCIKERVEINEKIYALEKEIRQLNAVKESIIDEYVAINRKFQNGDLVKYADSPQGRQFIIKDAYAVTYNEYYPIDEHTQIDIRYHVETKNGWKPNGGWAICEDKLVLIENN